MARYVLDTHALIYALATPRKLGRRARDALRRVERGRAEAWVPAIVVAEIARLHDLGRTELGLPSLRKLFEESPSVRFLPLDLDQLDEFAVLARIRDPFDRLIVGAARAQRAKLLSRDAELDELGLVELVWS